MSQVIIVSNRLPVSVKKENGKLAFYPSLGGLATGLSSYANDKRNTWIGWPGIASDELNDEERQEIVAELAKHNCRPVFLKQKQIDEFYNGYSNAVLWPLFHGLRHKEKSPGAVKRWWETYRRVNHEFAEAVLNESESGGRIWVHDYQLMLVPSMLRNGRHDITIGFFLHIPFPPVKTFNKLTQHTKLLSGILGADLVGFHTPDYVNNFLESCLEDGLATSQSNMLTLPDHTVRVGDFPMGIDYEKYSQAAKSKEVKAAIKKYRQRYKKLRVIVSVDRLDPSKGLVERLEAYRSYLDAQPNLRGKIVFSMVVAPSRTDVAAYKNLDRKLDSLVKEINKKYGTKEWKPVDYINVSTPFEEVTALFQIADVAFIAPLRDGMNLVAKEFIASQHRNGVLILSETAGAAQELPDAILVNPRRPQELVDALDQALRMRKRELRLRLRRMQRQLSTHTVQDWAKNFVATLQKPVPNTPRLRTWTLRERQRKALFKDFNESRIRLLLLDYDGSLVPFSDHYEDTAPPDTLVKLLRDLGENPLNDVVMISGRPASDLEKWFGDLPISLVAEHGASLKKVGNKTWQKLEKNDADWREILLPILEKYARLTPKARVEVKPHTLVWHYRASPPYYAQKYAVTIKRVLKPFLKKFGLEIMQGNKILEIKNPHISKGKAAQRWLNKYYDFILAIGDDATDEELFQALPDTAYSIKVGHRHTAARFRVASYREVLRLLGRMSK
jgi:trehalose 6-phosphate synthase/phosphatase